MGAHMDFNSPYVRKLATADVTVFCRGNVVYFLCSSRFHPSVFKLLRLFTKGKEQRHYVFVPSKKTERSFQVKRKSPPTGLELMSALQKGVRRKAEFIVNVPMLVALGLLGLFMYFVLVVHPRSSAAYENRFGESFGVKVGLEAKNEGLIGGALILASKPGNHERRS